MSQTTFAVFLPDRSLPIRIEADDFAVFGCELVLRKGEEVVARTSDRGFVVRTDVAAKSIVEAERLSTRPSALAKSVAPAAVSRLKSNPAPLWPFLAGGGAVFTVLCTVAWWLG